MNERFEDEIIQSTKMNLILNHSFFLKNRAFLKTVKHFFQFFLPLGTNEPHKAPVLSSTVTIYHSLYWNNTSHIVLLIMGK